jgi:predicted RNase H-like HicB family nuclease
MNSMENYRVVLRQSEEGYSVSCPGLPGCWSQGATEEEALSNIQIAIREYVEAAAEVGPCSYPADSGVAAVFTLIT